MPKRRMQDSGSRYLDSEDRPIGLTGAFAPVKGPQSVDYDDNDDPVGLTQAFGAIPDQDESRSWDESSKWKDFDWDAAFGDAEEEQPESTSNADSEQDRREASISRNADLPTDETPARESDDAGAPEAPERQASSAKRADSDASRPQGKQPPAKKGPKHGRHAAPEPEISPRLKKSRRTRKVLIVLVILLVLALGAVVFFGYRIITKQEAQQQNREQIAEQQDTLSSGAADDAVATSARLADVPDISALLGKTQDEVVEALGRGALITQNREVNEEGNPIKVELQIALTDEAADSKTGTPTVYLGLGEDGTTRQVGYSASASALGFGSLSFSDAVSNEHVIEKTLAKAGVDVPEGTATLPENKDEYSSYSSDGKTVVRERCPFNGDITVGGNDCTWSAVLSYDYTTQLVTGNLSDTVRIIYVYLTMK